MLLIAFLIVLALAALGYHISKDVFSPFVAQPAVWVGILVLYVVMAPPYYPIHDQLPSGIIMWSLFFQLGNYFMFYYTPTEGQRLYAEIVRPNKSVLNTYFVVSTLVVPFMFFYLLKLALDNDPEHIFLFLRLLNVGIDQFEVAPDFGLANYALPIPLVLLAYVLMYYKKLWPKIVVVVVNVFVALISMSKTSFLSIFFMLIYILYLQKKVKLKSIGITMICFLAFSIVFQFLRSTDDSQADFGVNSMLSLYTLSPLVTFDYFVEPFSSAHWGEYCFRFFYAVAHSLGSDIPPVENILPFVDIPETSNTYTILYPFYKDFGMGGIVIGGLVYGLLFGFVYRKVVSGIDSYKIIYTIMLNYLLLQFVQENILSNLSLNIQYIILIMLPFAFGGGTKQWQKLK